MLEAIIMDGRGFGRHPSMLEAIIMDGCGFKRHLSMPEGYFVDRTLQRNSVGARVARSRRQVNQEWPPGPSEKE